MLNQDIVLALLQASITGAGLVLAIYALIIPFSKRLFEHNLVNFLKSLRNGIDMLDGWFRDKFDEETKETAKRFFLNSFQAWSYPTYLRFGVGAIFSGYILTTLFSLAWIVNWERTGFGFLITPVFTLTTLIFLVVGLISIKDVHKIMLEDFNQLIESLKKDGDKS